MRQLNLAKKQIKFLDTLFQTKATEKNSLKKYKVSIVTYSRWLRNENFMTEFKRRIQAVYRQSDLTMAKFTPLAADKLAKLIDSEKEEVSRKACLDILSLPKPALASDDQQQRATLEISDDMARRLLDAMASATKRIPQKQNIKQANQKNKTAKGK